MDIKNRTLFESDNLDILEHFEDNLFDLIYLDPPFNSGRDYKGAIGSESENAEFKDTWTLVDMDHRLYDGIIKRDNYLPSFLDLTASMHSTGMKSYLIKMTIRLLELHRVLKPTGSIYLHCDPTACHYLKLIMDHIYGKDNFRNEISWRRDAAGKGGKKLSPQWPRVHDTILFYSKSCEYSFKQVYLDLDEKQMAAYTHIEVSSGRKFKVVQLGSYTKKAIKRMKKEGLIYTSKTGKQYKKYYLDEAQSTVGSIWTDIPGFGIRTNAKERCGYPTQKPLALLERIILASSNQDDLILDPFCGSGTTLIVAELLNRKWVGIDESEQAMNVVKNRMEEEYNLSEFSNMFDQRIIHKTSFYPDV